MVLLDSFFFNNDDIFIYMYIGWIKILIIVLVVDKYVRVMLDMVWSCVFFFIVNIISVFSIVVKGKVNIKISILIIKIV